MPTSRTHDLTDTWHGRFTYPGLYEPVSFVAHLDHKGALLSGTIEEPGRRSAADRMLAATVFGQVSGEAVTFLKTYDARFPGYDVVHYVGTVRDEGLEIVGTWTIPGSWSGTFLMIRSRGLVVATARTQVEKV